MADLGPNIQNNIFCKLNKALGEYRDNYIKPDSLHAIYSKPSVLEFVRMIRTKSAREDSMGNEMKKLNGAFLLVLVEQYLSKQLKKPEIEVAAPNKDEKEALCNDIDTCLSTIGAMADKFRNANALVRDRINSSPDSAKKDLNLEGFFFMRNCVAVSVNLFNSLKVNSHDKKEGDVSYKEFYAKSLMNFEPHLTIVGKKLTEAIDNTENLFSVKRDMIKFAYVQAFVLCGEYDEIDGGLGGLDKELRDDIRGIVDRLADASESTETVRSTTETAPTETESTETTENSAGETTESAGEAAAPEAGAEGTAEESTNGAESETYL